MLNKIINYIASLFKKEEKPYERYKNQAVKDIHEIFKLIDKSLYLMKEHWNYNPYYYNVKLAYYKERIEFLQERSNKNKEIYLSYKNLENLVSA